jgi:hypothetical protein
MQVRQFAGMLSCIFMYKSSMLLDEMGECVRAHDLVNIARPTSNLLGSVLSPRGPKSTSNVCKAYGGPSVDERSSNG